MQWVRVSYFHALHCGCYSLHDAVILLTCPTECCHSHCAITPLLITAVLFYSLHRSVSDFLQQRVLKSHLVCIALHQRNLVEILQNQMHLVEVYVTMKAILSTEPHTVVRQQPDHFSTPASTQTSSKARAIHNCNQDSLTKESHRPVTQASLLRSALPNNAKCLAVPRHPAAVIAKKKAPTHTDVLNEKASTYQRSAPQPGNTLQHINFKMKGINALIQATAADNSRHLSKLIQRGIMPSGSALQLLLKVRQSSSHESGLSLYYTGSL